MSEEFKIEIVNPEKSFLVKEDVLEVVVPAFEGEMGILKDHISIISFLKPGIIKVFSKSGDENYYVEDGILEFKDNNLSILTSTIIKISDLDKNKIENLISESEKASQQENLDDQSKFLIDVKEVEEFYKKNPNELPATTFQILLKNPKKTKNLVFLVIFFFQDYLAKKYTSRNCHI